jgi:hypothetical protein
MKGNSLFTILKAEKISLYPAYWLKRDRHPLECLYGREAAALPIAPAAFLEFIKASYIRMSRRGVIGGRLGRMSKYQAC